MTNTAVVMALTLNTSTGNWEYLGLVSTFSIPIPNPGNTFTVPVRYVTREKNSTYMSYLWDSLNPGSEVTLTSGTTVFDLSAPRTETINAWVDTGGANPDIGAPGDFQLIQIDATKLVVTNSSLTPNSSGVYALHWANIDGLVNSGDNATLTVTAVTNPAITTTDLDPCNNNAAYNFACAVAGGASTHTWSATGLPSGFSIDSGSGVISALASDTRTLVGQTPDVPITLTYSMPGVNYLPSVLTQSVTLHRYSIESVNPTSETALPDGTVYTAYNSPTTASAVVYGNFNSSATLTKAPYFSGSDSTLGILDSTLLAWTSSSQGLSVYSPSPQTLTSQGTLPASTNTTITVVITHFSNGATLTTPFNLTRAFSLKVNAPTHALTVTPSAITTRSSLHGSEASDIILVSAAFTDGAMGSFTFTSDGNSLFSGTFPPTGSSGNNILTPITLNSNISNGTYNLRASSGTESITIPVTINNTIDTATTGVISNITYSGYSGSYPLNYQFVGDDPTKQLQTFTITIPTSGGLQPQAGYFGFGNADSSIAQNVGIYPVGTSAFTPGTIPQLLTGTSCVVIINPSLPTNYNKSVDLVFYPYADASLTGQRVAHLFISQQGAVLQLTPTSITLTQGTAVSSGNVFTISGIGSYTPVSPYSFGTLPTLPAGLTFTANNTAGTLTLSGTPTSSNAPSGAPVTLTFTDGAGNRGAASVNILINATAGSVTVTSVTPSSWDRGQTTTLNIIGTNFSTTLANNTVNIIQQGANAPGITWPSLTVTAAGSDGKTLTATYTANAANWTGLTTLEVTRSDDSTHPGYISNLNITSSSPAVISSVSPSSSPAYSSVSLILYGSSFGANGDSCFIVFTDVSGTSTSYPATVSNNGGTVTSTGTIAVGATGTAQVTFKTSGGVSCNPVNFTVGTSTLGSISLAQVGGSKYTGGASIPGTTVPLTKNTPTTYNLSTTGGTPSYSWSPAAGYTLPVGVTLSGSQISANITSSSVQSFTLGITVTDSASPVNSKTAYFYFNLIGGAISLSQQTYTVHINDNVNQLIATSGGVTPFNFTYVGAFPTGLVLDPTTGYITGTVGGSVGTTTATVTVTDSATPKSSSTNSVTFNVLAALSVPNISNIAPNSGSTSGGTSVTLTVTDVRSGFIVYFGTSVASVISNTLVSNNGKIIVASPAGSLGAVPVTIKNTDGGVSPAYTSDPIPVPVVPFTYVLLVAPIFTSIDPQYGPFAGGQLAIITGQNFTSTTIVTFGGGSSAQQAVITSYSDTSLSIVTPPYTGAIIANTQIPVDLVLANGSDSIIAPKAYTYTPPPLITAVIPPIGPTAGGATIYITGLNFFASNGVNPRVFIGNTEVDPANITLKTS